MKKARKYDYKEAYNKNLSDSARLHYLENARHDAPGKMMKSPMKLESAAQEKKDLMMDMPVDERASAMKMYGKKSPMKMGGSWMSKHSRK